MFKGTQASRPLHTNIIQKTFDQSLQRAGEPADEQLRISYGVIAEVDEDNSTVRVDIFDKGGNRIRIGAGPDSKSQGSLLPIIQPITEIHHRFGSIRKGLIVRVYWKGKHVPGKDSLIEIISDAGESIFGSGRKDVRSNELATQVHEIFTGGLSG